MDKYRLPAEWEPQSAVQLTWPTPLSDWRDNIREINATYVEMATAIARYEKVLIVASAMCSIPTSLRRNKNVRMVREIGIFLIAIPAVQLVMSIVARIALGPDTVESGLNMAGVFTGLVVLALSQYFAYGTQLQSDVDGLL